MDSKSIINIIRSANKDRKSVRELLELLPLGSYSMESGDQCYSGTEIPIKYICIADGSTTHRIYITREAAQLRNLNDCILGWDPESGAYIYSVSYTVEGKMRFE